MSTIVPVTAVHQVITDKHVGKSDLSNLRDAGVAVTLV
jgi:hypothetical protein